MVEVNEEVGVVDEEEVVGWLDKVFEAMPCCSVHSNHLMYRQNRGRGPQDCTHHAYADHQHSVAVDAHLMLMINIFRLIMRSVLTTTQLFERGQ